jgi:Na+/H+ antiporter NhaC
VDETGSVFGWLSLVPPIVTIVMAIATKRVFLSLITGIALGVLIVQPDFSYWQALGDQPEGSVVAFTYSTASQWFYDLTQTFLWSQFVDSGHLQVMIFTAVLSMQVAMIHRSGGMTGVVRLLAPFARSRRGGQLVTWLLGMIIFIDDYANTLLLGSTMRPVTDRLKISREKLAYLVDSTAAPVSALALISTWVAVELSSIQSGYEAAGEPLGTQSFSVFLATIPVRFYIIFALLMVPIVAILRRDFGPMLAAEKRAVNDENLVSDFEDVSAGHWIDALLPICVTVAIALYILCRTGAEAIAAEAANALELGLPAPESGGALFDFALIIGNGDPYSSLVYGSIGGLLTIIALVLWRKSLTEEEIVLANYAGLKHVMPALFILWFAWTLSALTNADNLASGQYLAGLLTSRANSQMILPLWIFPTATFLVAGIVAFSTGTSWGTMATLFPVVIPTVITALKADTAYEFDVYHPLLIGSIGSVLAGAIFGDHCSPISDTTVLSSKASSCNHIAHVRTQMPYAILGGTVAVFLGTIPSALGAPSWLLIPLGVSVIVVVFLAIGRNAEDAEDA